ncbi:site-specific recombinase XerD [Kribbella orskensis]|uniref:Site-specific recombinase XerD n=1 Tax=Kribbella orskensis TaxID=2512216 RepID=A0ABY2BFJ1_9ACTN|nr:site-specific recombinase XerD [Kribbella sp. VKM Ac-2500]TCO18294.1 site-specific recombinase XerD [Kribbella orskensis]
MRAVSKKPSPKMRQPGGINPLPSGSLRVRVYAGIDPVKKHKMYLEETVPAGPDAQAKAEALRAEFVAEVYQRRHPRTDATVEQLLERHLKDGIFGTKTLKNYRGQADKHIVPCIGFTKVRRVDAEIIESFYSELRRCNDHCEGKPRTDHRTGLAHECDSRCKPHKCTPLKESSILYIHQILSGAFRRAVRYKWISINPMDFAEAPAAPKPKARPPSVSETARILTEAWKDPDWGTLIWLTMMGGNRRGELCGIRWRHVDLEREVIHVQRAIGQYGGETWESDTKSESDRRVVLDPETVAVLQEHHERCAQRATASGAKLSDDAFVFSREPDGSRHLRPDSVTQRFGRLVNRLGIVTSIHKLRSYNATELISAGFDLRIVAGRLGHGSGGVTTMRHYVPWVSEADQRAAGPMAVRAPLRPQAGTLPPMVMFEPTHPFEHIAVQLRDDIYQGRLPIGSAIPSVADLAQDRGVARSTIHRALHLLKQWGLVRVEPARPTLVLPSAPPAGQLSPVDVSVPGEAVADGDDIRPPRQILELEVRKLGTSMTTLRAKVAADDDDSLHRLLVGAVKRHGGLPSEIEDYELVVRVPGGVEILTTYVALAP